MFKAAMLNCHGHRVCTPTYIYCFYIHSPRIVHLQDLQSTGLPTLSTPLMLNPSVCFPKAFSIFPGGPTGWLDWPLRSPGGRPRAGSPLASTQMAHVSLDFIPLLSKRTSKNGVTHGHKRRK